MVKKKSRIETRTVFIIILILAIIGAGYVIFINLPPSIDYLNPEEINLNKENYINKTVIVKGTYDFETFPKIITTSTALEQNRELKLDILNVPNATDNLFQGEKYYFTGKIIREFPDDPILRNEIILILDKFEEV